MTFKLGRASKRNLQGVHPNLIRLVEECIRITPVDFTILKTGGLRTTAMQMAIFRSGASKLDGRSKKSMHQKQGDDFGHAVDLVPYVAGSPRWEWPLIYPIAGCMAHLSKNLDIGIKWGGVWDKEMDEYIGTDFNPGKLAQRMQAAVRAYTIRHMGPDFIDGPHYQLF